MMSKNFTVLSVLGLSVAVLCCGNREDNDKPFELPLRELHARIHGPSSEAKHYETALGNKVLFDAAKIEASSNDEIFLERSGCYGTCPSDSMRLLRRGEAFYWGGEFSERQGCYRADFPVEVFQVLSVVVDEIGFWGMLDAYTVLQTDGPSTYTAVKRGQEFKIVWNYLDSGPVQLWLFEQLLEQVAADLAWEIQPNVDSAIVCLQMDLLDRE